MGEAKSLGSSPTDVEIHKPQGRLPQQCLGREVADHQESMRGIQDASNLKQALKQGTGPGTEDTCSCNSHTFSRSLDHFTLSLLSGQ